MNVWAASDMVTLTEQSPAPAHDLVFDPDGRKIDLFAAGNEVISFQLVVESPQSLSSLRVSFSDLQNEIAGKIGSDSFKLYRLWAVEVSEFPPWYLRLSDHAPEPGRIYDCLIPADAPKLGMPFGKNAGERLALWVDLQVPKLCAAGRYTGAITLSADGTAEVKMPLNLQVYDFALPDERPVAAIGGFSSAELMSHFLQRDGRPFVPARLDRSDPQVIEGLTLLRQLMTLAHEHKLDLFDSNIRPIVKYDFSRGLKVDWTDYDAIVTPYLTGSAFADRLGVPAWPMPLGDGLGDLPASATERELYRERLGAIAKESDAHFRQLKLADRLFAWPLRSGAAQEAYGAYVPLARVLRGNSAETPILSPLPPEAPKQTLWQVPPEYAALWDMLAPPAMLLDSSLEAPKSSASPLRGAYLVPGEPPYSPSLDVIASPADVRAIGYLASANHLAGVFMPDVLGWQGDGFHDSPEPAATVGVGSYARPAGIEAASPPQGPRVPGPSGPKVRLFYPGSVIGVNQVLPSVRLKLFRRGMQDASYLWLMRQRGKKPSADMIRQSLARFVGRQAAGDHYLDARLDGWANDPQSYEMARRLLAEEVQAAVHPDEMTVQRALAQRTLWKRFDEATRDVRLEMVRPHVELAADNHVDITLRLSLCNERSTPCRIEARLGALPEESAGFTPVKEKDVSESVASLGCVTLELKLRGSSLPTTAEGKMYVPVELQVGQDPEPRKLEVPVPVVQAARPLRPITVDGDLSDWPMRAGISAGDFRLIGRRGRPDGKAQWTTTAFALRDNQNLYLAFRCAFPPGSPLVAQASNQVRYEQLMAFGEDLVEVLLDPGAAGKDAQDLYHLVIKPNGVLLTERGVQSDWPLGTWQYWAAGAKVAVRRGDGVWTAELAIPLSSFGSAGEADVWGANFMRFSALPGESSSWSGTPRYYYSPQNLGAMIMRPFGNPQTAGQSSP